MNTELLRQQIMTIAGSGVNPRYQFRAIFTLKGVQYPVQAVIGKRIASAFTESFCSNITIEVAMITKDFLTLFKARDNLYLTLFQEQVDSTSEVKFSNGLSIQTTFRAFFSDNSIASLRTDSGLQSVPYTDGSDDLRIFHVQLVDPIALSMSAKSAQGIFRFTSAFEAMKTFIVAKTDEDTQAGLPPLLGLDIVSPDITGEDAVRDQIIVDHQVRMAELPCYLQGREGGIYNQDIGSFIQNQRWYIYPLYNTQRFTKTERRLSVFVADSLKLPTADCTYKWEGQTLKVIATGGTKTQDISVAGDISGGNGVHFQRASNFFEAPVVVDGDNKAVYNREEISADIIRHKREDGLTFAPVGDNPITDNLAREQSRISSRDGMIMVVKWERSDIRLLTPGMPVRVYYDNGSVTTILEGTLIRAEEQWNTETPGLMQKLQVSAALLTFFLAKP